MSAADQNPKSPETGAATPPAPERNAGERPAGERGPGDRGHGDRHHRGDRGPRRRRDRDNSDGADGKRDDLVEKVVHINRSAKVVKGGRRFSFSALVVMGDRKGKVGIGLGKGGEVSDAIRKGGENAKVRMLPVSLSNNTIPHEVFAAFGGAKVLLRPASPGTGLICGKTVRAVVESVGIKDILSKSLGSKNAANVAKATLKALIQLRRREDILKARGLESRLNKAA